LEVGQHFSNLGALALAGGRHRPARRSAVEARPFGRPPDGSRLIATETTPHPIPANLARPGVLGNKNGMRKSTQVNALQAHKEYSVGNNKNPNEKRPGEKEPGTFHYNPGNMSGKTAEDSEPPKDAKSKITQQKSKAKNDD